MSTAATLHLVVGDDGRSASFGDLQIRWLLEHGHVAHVRDVSTSPATAIGYYRPLNVSTCDELAAIVQAIAELRTCDFCETTPTPWQVNVRPFDSPFAGGGRFARPVFVCAECVDAVRTRDATTLIDRRVSSALGMAIARGGAAADAARAISPAQIREVRGQVETFVRAVLAHRKGWPTAAEVS